jgi:hypothetical protein
MANLDVGAWSHSGIQSRSRSSAASDAVKLSDDDLDFPAADHPVRELITFSIFASGVVAFLVWGGSKLFEAIF